VIEPGQGVFGNFQLLDSTGVRGVVVGRQFGSMLITWRRRTGTWLGFGVSIFGRIVADRRL